MSLSSSILSSERYEELEQLMGQLPKGDREGSRRALEVALDAITAEYVGNPSSALKEQKQVLEENLAVIRSVSVFCAALYAEVYEVKNRD